MERLLTVAVMIGAMAVQLAAQNVQREIVVLSLGGAVLVPGISNPGWWDEPSCGRPPGRYGPAYACDPFYAGNGAPSVTIAIPRFVAPPAPAPPPPPAPAARPEIREYHWPSSGSDSSAATFSIVSKDGQAQSAVMVWVQDDAVCHVTSGGTQGRMPMDSIDRQATRQRNAEKRLNLWLPDESTMAHLQVSISGSGLRGTVEQSLSPAGAEALHRLIRRPVRPEPGRRAKVVTRPARQDVTVGLASYAGG